MGGSFIGNWVCSSGNFALEPRGWSGNIGLFDASSGVKRRNELDMWDKTWYRHI